MINKSVMKCILCNNDKCGEFITINDKKYHLCCIEQLQQENTKLKEDLFKIKLELKVANNNRCLGDLGCRCFKVSLSDYEEVILKYKELYSRIDKAIEYINECTKYDVDDNTGEDIEIDKLLEILKGKNE